MKAAILAIGTELTDGEVANSNAAWISAELHRIGLCVDTHLTVDDHRGRIVEALNFLEINHDLILVTGGLGPTSDDLTRDCIAEWAKVGKFFDDASWQRIREFFSMRNLTVPDTNRIQCEFPIGSRILFNPAGTAPGFCLEKGVKVIVLPGPPREVKAMWPEVVREEIARFIAPEDVPVLLVLKTIGLGESHIAEICEPLFEGFRDKVTPGYRASIPFVYIKIFTLEKWRREAQILKSKIEEALIGKVHFLPDVNVVDEIVRLLRQNSATLNLRIADTSQHRFFSMKLVQSLSRCEFDSMHVSLVSGREPSDVCLLVGDLEWEIVWNGRSLKKDKFRWSSSKDVFLLERNEREASEKALYEIWKELTK